jgi:hypothetical protein
MVAPEKKGFCRASQNAAAHRKKTGGLPQVAAAI